MKIGEQYKTKRGNIIEIVSISQDYLRIKFRLCKKSDTLLEVGDEVWMDTKYLLNFELLSNQTNDKNDCSFFIGDKVVLREDVHTTIGLFKKGYIGTIRNNNSRLLQIKFDSHLHAINIPVGKVKLFSRVLSPKINDEPIGEKECGVELKCGHNNPECEIVWATALLTKSISQCLSHEKYQWCRTHKKEIKG